MPPQSSGVFTSSAKKRGVLAGGLFAVALGLAGCHAGRPEPRCPSSASPRAAPPARPIAVDSSRPEPRRPPMETRSPAQLLIGAEALQPGLRSPPEIHRSVTRALFPRSLPDLDHCPKPSWEPQTWVEVDQLQSDNVALGRFVPILEQVLTGTFTHPAATQTLFIYRIDNCQAGLEKQFHYAVFDSSELGSPKEKPALRWETTLGPVHSLLQEPGQPPRFLVPTLSGYVLVELNREFAQGAPLGLASDSVSRAGKPVQEPFREIAAYTASAKRCFLFFVEPSRPRELIAEGQPCRRP
jgi:hypothetical protein